MQPAISVSIPISKQMKQAVEGKVIRDILCETRYQGEYQLGTVSFEGICNIFGRRVIKADSNFIHADNGMLAEFGYDGSGSIRYFRNDEDFMPIIKKAPKTGGFIVRFVFDGSCLVLMLNGWTCRFGIRHVDAPGKYPFITKYPLDVTDENDFTPASFRNWLGKNPKSAIFEACASVKGAFERKQANRHPATNGTSLIIICT